MRELDSVERAVLAELYACGEKVNHRHDHERRVVVERLEKGGLNDMHSWSALNRLEGLGLVESRGWGRIKAQPLGAALALGLEAPVLADAALGRPIRLSALAS